MTWVPVSGEMLVDFDPFRFGGSRYRVNPPLIGRLVLFPRLARIETAVANARRRVTGVRLEVRWRVVSAWRTLRHGYTGEEGEWD